MGHRIRVVQSAKINNTLVAKTEFWKNFFKLLLTGKQVKSLWLHTVSAIEIFVTNDGNYVIIKNLIPKEDGKGNTVV